jgi:spermidine/putrescine transport system substrate-binding protein
VVKEGEIFIIYEADVMAKNLDVFPYNCANEEALKVVSDQYKNNPALNLSAETMNKAVSVKDVGEAEVVYDKYWSEFMSK